MNDKTVVAIGEILWDVFPDQKTEGGSSMNVALNLHKQGITSKFISAIGNDDNGKDLIAFLASQKFPSDLIQVASYPTSTVEVTLDEHKHATYSIVEPVAWDAIELTTENIEAVKSADALVYCSLSCRNELSRNTILSLLEHAKLKIFDINLRPPFYTIQTIKLLLREADILKINEDELDYLRGSLSLSGDTEEELLQQISFQFNIDTICFTVGENGASVLHENKLYHHKGYKVQVADSVGAGDSFLATFVSSYLQAYPMEIILDRACKVGSYVASKHGANPAYGKEIFN